MARNIIFNDGDSLSVPVISGTVSGDAVVWGNQPGVALTDRSDGGNATGYATVKFSGVIEVELAGAVDADAVYIDPTDYALTLTDSADDVFFGVCLGASDATTDLVYVRIGGIEPASGS